MEEVRGRLAVGEAAAARVAVLQATVDAEVARRTEEVLAVHRKEFEMSAREEIHVLETQLAEMRGHLKMMRMVEEAHEIMKVSQRDMKDTIAELEGEVEKYRAAASTKSSHALGKMGEAEMFEMLNQYVLPRFQYSEVKDVSAIRHVGDFHLWVHGPTGKRVKIMIDVKKYSTPIQKGEVEKLYSDLDGDDSQAGIMISTGSPIYSKAQFQIVKTTGNKPCMFLSFEKLDDGIRQEALCWAVRVLVGLVALNGDSEQEAVMASVHAFMGDMNATLLEVDACMRSSKNLYDMLKRMKEKMAERIAAHNTTLGVAADTIQHEEEDPMRCAGKNQNKSRCKSRRLPVGLYCQRHMTQAEEE
jgi:hypothetical protein